ncbi:MAG: hypothetical protein ACTH8P_15665 [Ewingella sp.]|uniref:hypothetical protein n=1 Tax=Ewingella TaxID=41201 RepID=UPI003365A6B7
MSDIFISYVTTKNKVSAYALSTAMEVGDYIQGICSKSGSYKTFRTDRVVGFFGCMEDAEVYTEKVREFLVSEPGARELPLFVIERKKHKKYESPGMLRPLDFSGPLEICFTGFKKEDKERLTTAAAASGMIVRKDITVNLHFLCGGYNAGPKKLEVARKKGTMILREDELLALISTGELPDDYDNQ